MDYLNIGGSSGTLTFDFEDMKIHFERSGNIAKILMLPNMDLSFSDITGIELRKPSFMKLGGISFIVNGKKLLVEGNSAETDATQFASKTQSEYAILVQAVERLRKINPQIQLRGENGFNAEKIYYKVNKVQTAQSSSKDGVKVAPTQLSGYDDVIKFFGVLTSTKPELLNAIKSMVDSIPSDEKIQGAFRSTFLKQNRGQYSVTDVMYLVTHRKIYYCGEDGKSSVLLPRYKSGYVYFKDIHGVTAGTAFLGNYLQFETHNDDYKIQDTKIDIEEIRKLFEENIIRAKEEVIPNFIPQSTPSVAAQLKDFKELLDLGVITQEEFDAKKKQLLGL